MKLRKTDASAEAFLKTMAERQDALERQLSSLAAAVESIEKRLAARDEPLFAGADDDLAEVLFVDGPGEMQARKHGMKAEVKAVIAAAAAVAGEMARVRRVRALPAAQDAGSTWSQQGRVGVVGSHRLR